jgi:16S rRNA (cytidine1402-2'-O)-methyltransferase
VGKGRRGRDEAGADRPGGVRAPAPASESSPAIGTLHLVATPIGHLNDVTLRALEVLAQVDRIAAEDTRQVRKLLARHGIEPPILEPYHARNEARMTERLAGRLQRGEMLALVTDAGTPGISDPAYRLTRAALEIGARVTAIPGPSAVVAALIVSGLPTDRFVFEGFPPRRSGPRRRALERLAELPHTLVFFEAPNRVHHLLADVLAVLGDRPLAVARELTKLYEEVWRGTVSEYLAGTPSKPPRGESTVVVGGLSRALFRRAAEEKNGEED